MPYKENKEIYWAQFFSSVAKNLVGKDSYTRMGIHTCYMENSTLVDAANVRISNSDTSTYGLSFSKNRNIFSCPSTLT